MNWIPCLLLGKERSWSVILLMVLLFMCHTSKTYGYDSLDPNGNITIKWDVIQENDDSTQNVRVSVVNYQLFRHIDYPGWKISWDWANGEVIWSILGAEATEQGNCSAFKGKALPHCCLKRPVIIDLLPGAPYNQQVFNCCKGGILSSMMQHQDKYQAGFQLQLGNANTSSIPGIPENFTLGVPGYTCGPARRVAPTTFYEDQGRRKTHALATWNVTCSYSQFQASLAPTCCVSLSAFYNNTIIPCPKCSCACRGQAGSTCVAPGSNPPEIIPQQHNGAPPQVLQCSNNMCPIGVHWHVKESYKEYWRVKITISNYNFARNYSDWSLVVLHPNLSNVTQVFSFNYKPLDTYGNINDSGVMFGIPFYNDMLLQSGNMGNVQTEMLMHKDAGIFTFKQGWAFPRKISFNGDECVMPRPDDYPSLPNASSSPHFHAHASILFSLLLFFFLL